MITIKSIPLKNYTKQFDKSVVIFGSHTCSACKTVTEIVVPLMEMAHTDTEFMFLDCEEFVGTADYYNIEYYPTLAYFEYGEEVRRIQSTNIKEIESKLFK
jgi:thioredoxin-like negative regulator of GroEL